VNSIKRYYVTSTDVDITKTILNIKHLVTFS